MRSFLSESKRRKGGGFTLIELLIVIAILAILAAVVIFVLNPAETLRQTRDAQRISDLATIKSAIGIYTTSTTTPYLASNTDNTACKSSATGAWASGDRIWYSASMDVSSTTDISLDGGSGSTPMAFQRAATAYRSVDSTGWIPINLLSLSSGSPVEAWPVDPVNSFTTESSSTAASVTGTAHVYRYACESTGLAYEVDARLESIQYASKMTTDGGNNSFLLESGTDLRIFGSGSDF